MPLNFEFLLLEEFVLNPFKFKVLKKEIKKLYSDQKKKEEEEKNQIMKISEQNDSYVMDFVI